VTAVKFIKTSAGGHLLHVKLRSILITGRLCASTTLLADQLLKIGECGWFLQVG